jgi:hypothetical protein
MRRAYAYAIEHDLDRPRGYASSSSSSLSDHGGRRFVSGRTGERDGPDACTPARNRVPAFRRADLDRPSKQYELRSGAGSVAVAWLGRAHAVGPAGAGRARGRDRCGRASCYSLPGARSGVCVGACVRTRRD